MVINTSWIYIHFRDWIYINLTNPFKIMRRIKGVFISPKLYFIHGKNRYPPIIFAPKLSKIHIMSSDVGWKDKYETPRFEHAPYIWIHLFKYNFIWYWEPSLHEQNYVDEYWEQALWYLYYYDTYSQGLLDKPNIEKAKESWPWEDYKTKKSSWNDKFLIK